MAVIDRYTHVVLNYLEGINKTSTMTLQDLFDRYNYEEFHSNAGIRTDLFARNPKSVRLTDFFGGVQEVELDHAKHRSRVADEDINAAVQRSNRISERARPHRLRTKDAQLPRKEKKLGYKRTSEAATMLIIGHILLAGWALFIRRKQL